MSSVASSPEKIDQESGPLDLSSFDIYQLLELFIVLLEEQTRRYIGLRTYPGTNEIKKDLVKAHVAVDCIISLVEKMEPYLNDSEKTRLRGIITELQISYAEQMK